MLRKLFGALSVCVFIIFFFSFFATNNAFAQSCTGSLSKTYKTCAGRVWPNCAGGTATSTQTVSCAIYFGEVGCGSSFDHTDCYNINSSRTCSTTQYSWEACCTPYSQGCVLGCTANERMCNPCTGLCTCSGPACGGTPTPEPPPPPLTCTVQGKKVIMPGNQPIEPAASQPVYKNGGTPLTGEPYYHSQTSTSTYSVPNIAGYTTGYTLCYNSTDCHTGAITPGNSKSVDYASCLSENYVPCTAPNVPAGCDPYHYADLWWHFTPLPPTASCTVTPSTVPYGGNPGINLYSTNASYCEIHDGLNGLDYLNAGYFTSGTYYAGVQTTPGNYQGRVICYNSSWVASAAGYCNYTVNPPPSVAAWFQVKDGDVTTNGNINSSVPATATIPYFDVKGLGGFPGIPVYGTSTNLTYSNVSATHWKVNSSYASTNDEYKSDYFLKEIPSDVTPKQIGSSITSADFDFKPANLKYDYYWYKYDGASPLTINGDINFGTKKVILIVKQADVTLKGKINLDDGSGFFLLVTGGNIIVDPGVANLEGIFVADKKFLTGTSVTQLQVRGTIAAYQGIDLKRNLAAANSTTPAELFEYAPDLELLFPGVFATHTMNWQEVAP